MYKYLIFLVAFVISFVQSTSFKECASGPTYWCESLENANKCNAFKHCLDGVWSRHKKYLDVSLDLESDNKCASCYECIRGDIANCPEGIKLQLDNLSEMYLKSIPPRTICQLANGCQQKQVQEQPKEPLEQQQEKCGLLHPRHWCDNIENARKCESLEQCVKNVWTRLPPMVLSPEYESSETVCGFCIWSFNKLHELLQQNATELNIQEYLEGTCQLLPSGLAQKECIEAVDKNFLEIYDLLRDNTDPGIICRVIKLCKDEVLVEMSSVKSEQKPMIDIKIVDSDDTVLDTPLTRKSHLLGSKTEVLVAQMMRSNGVGCELCNLIFNAAKFMKENGKTDDEIVAFIKEETCGRLGNLSGQCEKYIDIKSFDILNDLIVNKHESSILCHDMGLCMKIQMTSESTRRFYDIDARDSSNCTVCTSVMKTVKTMLDDNKSEDEILDYMRKNLCEQSAKYEQMCKTVVTAYGPVILKLLANNLSPDQICTLIGFCGQPATLTEVHVNEPYTINQDQNCIMCEFVMTTLSKYITQNASQAQVEKALEYVCRMLPSTVRAECNTFVEQYEPVIADLIAKKIDPKQVCQKLGLCKAADEAVAVELKKLDDPKPECVLCEYIMSMVSQYMHQNATAQEIEGWLNQVCDRLMPSTMRDACKQFVDQYEPIIIAVLTQHDTTEKLCQMMHFCVAELTPITGPRDEIYCESCEYTIKFIKYEMEKERSQKAMTNALEHVCQIAPQHISQKCESIVSTYGMFLITMLDKYVDPATICKKLNLCPQQTNQLEQVVVKPIEIQPAQTPLKIVDLIPAQPVFKKTELVEAGSDSLVKSNLPEDTLQCNLCIYVAEVLNSLLKQNKTEMEILVELEKICRFFKSPIKDQCQSFIDQYGPYVLQLLASDFNPQEICTNMKVCPAGNENNGFRALLSTYRKRSAN